MARESSWGDLIPAGIIPRNIRRKVRSDGFLNTAVTITELFVRKRIGRRVLDPLVERGIVQVLSRRDLQHKAREWVEVSEGRDGELSPFVSRLESGYVLTETGLATTTDFQIVGESADTPCHARQATMAMCARELFFGRLPVGGLLGVKPSMEPPVLDTVAPLIPRYPTNYYHWMVETVPKVRFLREFERQTGTDVTVLVSSNAPPFVEETLTLLGWPDDRILRATEPMYEVRNLILPSYPERTKGDFHWLQQEILDDVPGEGTRTGGDSADRIYVSRANAVSRRVVNEDAVMETLSEYEFESYLLEDRTLAENARLFHNADVVVGPHGAGLTDIIFAENCALVELFGARINRAYENLSETLGLIYEPIFCQADSADIVVDTAELDAKVSKLLD